MEAEVRASYPDSDVTLVKGTNGVFDVTCDGKLVYSKASSGQRFPDVGEVAKLIKQKVG